MSKADLLLYQGDDYAATVTVEQAGLDPDQVIAGYTARAQIRDDFADVAPGVVLEVATAVDSPIITLFIPAADTAKLAGDYVWDLQIISPTNVITTILSGYVRVQPEVTR